MNTSCSSSTEDGPISSLKVDTKERVTVTHIESPECFYVQLVRLKPQLNNLSKLLTNYVKENPPIIENPQPSM